MDRFFTWIQRFNSLIPLAILVIGLAGISWAFFQSHEKKDPSITLPGASSESNKIYRLGRGEYYVGSDTFVLPLYRSTGETPQYGEIGSGKETRNLLITSEKSQKTYWLFKDQMQVIEKFDQVQVNDSSEEMLFVLARPFQEKDPPKYADSNSAYLVKFDGSTPKLVLTKIDEVIDRRETNGKIKLLYQSGSTIRLAKISLSNGALVSDKELSNMLVP